MIISSPTSNNIHIILDENDLKMNKISLCNLLSNNSHKSTLISKLLNNTSISSANIFTYKFKIFYIDVIL
jgi:hypothetical protein